MIRRFSFASAAVMAFALASPGTGQAQNVFVKGGAAIPTGEEFETGWMVAGGVRFPLGPGGLWFGFEGSYGQNGDANVAPDLVAANPVGAMALLGLNLPVPGNISPYVYAGAGILALKISIDQFDVNETRSSFGYQLGGGANFGNGIVTPFIEGRVEFSEDIDFFAANFGVSIGIN